MSQNTGVDKLKAAITFSIIVNVVYGIAFFIAPVMMSDMAGGVPVENGWLRWSGGVLLGLVVGGIHVYRDPARQKSMITTLTFAPLFAGLGLLYTLLAEKYSVHAWFIVVPCLILFALFGVMFWARRGAKEALE